MVKILREVYLPFADRFAPTALAEDESAVAAISVSWLLADVAARPVGCVQHFRENDHYTFCFLSVLQHYRCQGLGTRLVEAVARQASDTGCDRLLIAVRLSLQENVSFFRHRGFQWVAPFGTEGHGLFVRHLEEQK